MTSSQSETSADFDLVFPYQILWPGYGKKSVDLVDIAFNEHEYKLLNSVITLFDPDAPSITVEQVQEFALSLEVDGKHRDQFVKNVWLISCFYLSPVHARILGNDRASVTALLSKIAETAGELDDLLGQLPPKVDAVMLYLRPVEPEVLLPSGPTFFDTSREMHDLALVAQRMADDIAAGDGRPAEFVRDTAIELFLTELHLAGVYDLRISDGNKSRGPHLAGKSGEFLTRILGHIAPSLPDESWVPKIKPIRTKLNRKRAAKGARQTT